MMTIQSEALVYLSEIIKDLTSSQHDIKMILRKGQLICEMLGWEKLRLWFYRELNGYYPDVSLPPYRSIYCEQKWEPTIDIADKIFWRTDAEFGNIPLEYIEPKITYKECRENIDWIITATKSGFEYKTKITKNYT